MKLHSDFSNDDVATDLAVRQDVKKSLQVNSVNVQLEMKIFLTFFII